MYNSNSCTVGVLSNHNEHYTHNIDPRASCWNTKCYKWHLEGLGPNFGHKLNKFVLAQSSVRTNYFSKNNVATLSLSHLPPAPPSSPVLPHPPPLSPLFQAPPPITNSFRSTVPNRVNTTTAILLQGCQAKRHVAIPKHHNCYLVPRKPVRTDLLLCDRWQLNFNSSMHLLLKKVT